MQQEINYLRNKETVCNPQDIKKKSKQGTILAYDDGLASAPVCRRLIIHTLLSIMSSYPQGQRLGY
jgi:hypothetical protein